MKNEKLAILFKFWIAFRVIHELQLNALILPVIQKWNVIIHYMTMRTTQKIRIQKLCLTSFHVIPSICHNPSLYPVNSILVITLSYDWFTWVPYVKIMCVSNKTAFLLYTTFIFKNILPSVWKVIFQTHDKCFLFCYWVSQLPFIIIL